MELMSQWYDFAKMAKHAEYLSRSKKPRERARELSACLLAMPARANLRSQVCDQCNLSFDKGPSQ